MIEADSWVKDALAGLKEIFGPRLLYLGLQGSYRRGEATETSDIDLVTVLDRVSLDDLDAYRGVVHALPEGEKACGFICGRDDLLLWPRQELFQFKMDTRDYYGRLDDFLPPVGRSDIIAGLRLGAGGLMHLLTHSYLYAAPESRPEILKGAYKGAFFSLLLQNYLESGHYRAAKKELLSSLPEGPEKTIVAAGLDFSAWLDDNSEKQAFNLILAWCRKVLALDFK